MRLSPFRRPLFAVPKDRALLIVRDEFPGWLFLGGLLSSRARFRFTNRTQY